MSWSSITYATVDGRPLQRDNGGQVQVTTCTTRNCSKPLHFQSGVWWEFREWSDFRTWKRHPHGSPWSTQLRRSAHE